MKAEILALDERRGLVVQKHQQIIAWKRKEMVAGEQHLKNENPSCYVHSGARWYLNED